MLPCSPSAASVAAIGPIGVAGVAVSRQEFRLLISVSELFVLLLFFLWFNFLTPSKI